MPWSSAQIYPMMLENLNERDRRLYVASEALRFGYGGISKVHKLSGVSRVTIAKGVNELRVGKKPDGRIRKVGGGRKKIDVTQPGIRQTLVSLLDTKGDPMRSVLWTTQAVDKLTEQLNKRGYTVSNYTVYYLLREEGYSLKSNKKNIEGIPHPDRDKQFQHINSTCKIFEEHRNPIISIDCKKKEQIVNFKKTMGGNGQRAGKKTKPRLTPTISVLWQTV